jgi:hypothetical protein
MTLFVEAALAFARLRPQEQKLLRPDWFDVVRSVERHTMGKNPILSGALNKALEECNIVMRSAKELNAYRSFLLELYVYGKKQRRRAS